MGQLLYWIQLDLNYLELIVFEARVVIAPVQLHHSGSKSAAMANTYFYLTVWPPVLLRFVHIINFAENFLFCILKDMLMRFPDTI